MSRHKKLNKNNDTEASAATISKPGVSHSSTDDLEARIGMLDDASLQLLLNGSIRVYRQMTILNVQVL